MSNNPLECSKEIVNINEVDSITEATPGITLANGLLYLDMNIYNEEEKTNCDVEITSREGFKNHIGESLPLNSIKNLAYEENNISCFNEQLEGKRKDAGTDCQQKENCLKQDRYRLRTRKRNNSSWQVLDEKPLKRKIKDVLLTSDGGYENECPSCGKSVKSALLLSEHVKCCMSVWEGRETIFKCEKCKSTFLTSRGLESHIANNCKSLTLTYTCDICKENFIRKSELRRHISNHLLNRDDSESKSSAVSSCSLCGKSFRRSLSLRLHLRRQHGISYKCKACKRSFDSAEKLGRHEATACSSGTEPRVCSACGKTYRDGASYRRHLSWRKCSRNKSDGGNEPEHICDECGIPYPKLVSLKIHILNVHRGINYECNACGERFPGREELDGHGECRGGGEEAMDEEKEMTYPCNECGKVFTRRDYLKKHQYVHANVLYKCKYCYCAFMKEKSYSRHIERMNCSKSARKIRMAEFNFRKCRICEVEYDTEEELIKHFRDSHPGEAPHQCFCCEHRLPTFEDLKTHIHHHNVKKYTCNLCGKPYTSQEGFRKHRLKHKGAEFKCRYCEAEFLNGSRYKFHEKTCKKNPESGYKPESQEQSSGAKKKDGKPKQSRQLHWESRIIMKRLRGDPSQDTSQETFGNKTTASFFDEDEDETELTTRERGWFDDYYKTEEDDIAFGLRGKVDCESDECDVSEFLRPEPRKKAEDMGEEDGSDDTAESETDSSSEEDEDVGEEDEENEAVAGYNPKRCRICVVTFDQEYELLHHFIKSHPEEMAHECPFCGSQSPLYAQLREHMKTHGIGTNIHHCDNCSKRFRSEKKMRTHNVRCKGLNGVPEDGQQTMGEVLAEQCKRCRKVFYTRFGYRRHKQQCKAKREREKKKRKRANVKLAKRETQEMETTLDNVGLGFEDETQAETVQENPKPPETEKSKPCYVAEPPLDSFPCRLCDKKFQYERGIVMHFKSSHPGHKPLICHVCNMHLADKLKEHLKTHGIGEEFVCELCGKRFNQKFLSKIHEMWHQGIEYKCSNCKQKFLNREKMDKHVAEGRCRNRQSLMRLPCVICGKSYRSKFGLSKHYITHTPKELRPVKNKMNCEYCGKWFENNNGLQRHRRIHTGERPFCCRYCPKAFAQEGNCKAHERTHTGESKPRKRKQQTGGESVVETVQVQVATPAEPILAQVQPEMVAQVPCADAVAYPSHISLYVFSGDIAIN